MGKQTVLASLVNASAVAVGSSERTILQSVGWIDASSVYGSAMKFELFMNTVTQAHTGTRTALPLFDAINNIHTNNTKRTTIEIKYQNMIPNTGNSTAANSYILIEIDWEALRVKWSGALFTGSGVGNACFQGNEPIDALGSAIEMQSWSPDAGRGNPIGYTPFVYLETGPGRKLVKLPLFLLGLSSVGFFPAAGRNIASYAITTDDGQVVATSLTPPAETSTEEVSGIKISELSAVETLQDDDLFVLSQDNPAGDAYDASLNVTLANLRAGIVIGEIVNLYYDGDYILGPISSGTWMVHLQGQQSSGSGDLDEDVLVSISRKYTVAAGQYLWFKCTDMSTTFSGVSELYNSSSSTPATSDPGWLAYTTTSDPKAESYDAQTRPDNDGITFLFEGVETPYCVGFAIKVA